MEKFSNRSGDTSGAQRQQPFVRVAPPTVHAGVGNALKTAFRMDGDMRSLAPFEDLLKRLG